MKQLSRFHKKLFAAAAVIAVLSLSAGQAEAGAYTQTNLVSDLPGLAKLLEPELVNPWGISHTATSPFWTSNQGTSTANLFAVNGQTSVSKVSPANTNGNITIPPTGGPGPTGQVANTNTSSFLIPISTGGDGNSAHFIFANLNGTISAWDTGQTAFIQPLATTAGAVFTGLAINTAQTLLYAADGAQNRVAVFNSSFTPTSLGANAFATPAAIATLGLVPFNVQNINGNIYVTYALPGRAAEIAAPEGSGAVAIFDANGNLINTLITGSKLASPWGVALAPAGFGPFGGDLLVGNFSFIASEINAFDSNGNFVGTIPIDPGNSNTPGGLWSLIFGVGGTNGGDPNTLYFTDGIDGETHGLFAALTPAPEPSGLAILGSALALLAVSRIRTRRRA
jgi:uncharacterized protein (TIGR03118 family)